MRVIRVKFPNGDLFEIPATVIAEMRTSYYAKVDGYEFDSPEWKEEFEFSMSHDELYDWVANNTDWRDVKQHAVKIRHDAIDYDKEWHNAKFDTEDK